ncbi:MAG TPA: hypothetical protein VIK69_12435, partial [Methylophilaceae bacterium]
IQHLRQQVPALGGRVYQAFLAPANTQRPFATVKLMDGGGSVSISFAGDHLVEVRIYDDMTSSFVKLDELAYQVIQALHGEVVDGETGERYEVAWEPGMIDFTEDDRRLIGRLLRFSVPAIHERG